MEDRDPRIKYTQVHLGRLVRWDEATASVVLLSVKAHLTGSKLRSSKPGVQMEEIATHCYMYTVTKIKITVLFTERLRKRHFSTELGYLKLVANQARDLVGRFGRRTALQS